MDDDLLSSALATVMLVVFIVYTMPEFGRVRNSY